MSWYDEALRSASTEQGPNLAARKRLVSAMMGPVEGRPPTEPVSLGGVKVSPKQFEVWVRDQLSRRSNAAGAADHGYMVPDVNSLPVVGAAQPVFYQAATFGLLNDSAGRGYKQDELQGPLGQFRDVDWTWRHLVLQPGEDTLLAVERSRITAFDLAGGRPRWDVRLRNAWSAAPLRPLVCGPRIYVRTAAAPGRAGVTCLDGKTGRNLWLRDCGGPVAGDPLWYRGRLYALCIGPAGGQLASPLCLVELDPETGGMLSRQEILETVDRENLPGDCQACWAGNRLVVLFAGSVIVTDLKGRIEWIRQETTLPYTTDATSIHQHYQPALASDGRLFVQQPGNCAVDCLALETGQRPGGGASSASRRSSISPTAGSSRRRLAASSP